MRTRPFLIAGLVAGFTLAAFPARADSGSTGAGIIFGGAIGAVLGGPPGWVAGMAIGAAIGEGEAGRQARINGTTRYAEAPQPRQAASVALPPPGFNGVPADYVERRAAPRPTYVVQHAPAYHAPRAVYPAPAYYGPPRHYYRPYYY